MYTATLNEPIKSTTAWAGKVDLVVVDSFFLPPHVTAVPEKIGRVLGVLKGGKRDDESADDTTTNCLGIVDISWAVQSIVQGRRLALDEDPRYLLFRTDTGGGGGGSGSAPGSLDRFLSVAGSSAPPASHSGASVYSIKLRRGDELIRFDA